MKISLQNHSPVFTGELVKLKRKLLSSKCKVTRQTSQSHCRNKQPQVLCGSGSHLLLTCKRAVVTAHIQRSRLTLAALNMYLEVIQDGLFSSVARMRQVAITLVKHGPSTLLEGGEIGRAHV